MAERTQIWSCGGGTQSAGIAALIVSGVLPKPDLAVIVDTGREKSSTWEYADTVLIPQLAAVGVELQRIAKERYATVDLYRNDDLLIPAFTFATGKAGKFPTFCSNEWKKRVTMRWLKDIGVTRCDNWIGISVDEIRRVKASDVGWLQNKYPLIDLRMRREDCVRVVAEMGWPVPPRSSCWMCPNMADAEWSEMKQNRPGDFALAVGFEKQMRETDPFLYLHSSGVPLDEVIFSSVAVSQVDNSCASGYCYV